MKYYLRIFPATQFQFINMMILLRILIDLLQCPVYFSALQSQFQSHNDMISSLDMCTRNDRPLVLSASSDCSVQLWDVYGNKIGIFGQVGLLMYLM